MYLFLHVLWHSLGCAPCAGPEKALLFRFFHLISLNSDAEAEKKRKEEDEKKRAEIGEFPNRRRNMLISGAVALTAMLGYAFMSGLIQVTN